MKPQSAIARTMAAAVAIACTLAPALAWATPACPPGTGSPRYTGYLLPVPSGLGGLALVALIVSAARGETNRVLKLVLGVCAFGGGVVMGDVLFFVFGMSCVPK